jgi:hypothetical protein
MARDTEIDHPCHYTKGKYEVWDVLVDWELPYLLATAVKHIARAGHKKGNPLLKDLRKARNYLNKYIEIIEEEELVIFKKDVTNRIKQKALEKLNQPGIIKGK